MHNLNKIAEVESSGCDCVNHAHYLSELQVERALQGSFRPTSLHYMVEPFRIYFARNDLPYGGAYQFRQYSNRRMEAL